MEKLEDQQSKKYDKQKYDPELPLNTISYLDMTDGSQGGFYAYYQQIKLLRAKAVAQKREGSIQYIIKVPSMKITKEDTKNNVPEGSEWTIKISAKGFYPQKISLKQGEKLTNGKDFDDSKFLKKMYYQNFSFTLPNFLGVMVAEQIRFKIIDYIYTDQEDQFELKQKWNSSYLFQILIEENIANVIYRNWQDWSQQNPQVYFCDQIIQCINQHIPSP